MVFHKFSCSRKVFGLKASLVLLSMRVFSISLFFDLQTMVESSLAFRMLIWRDVLMRFLAGD